MQGIKCFWPACQTLTSVINWISTIVQNYFDAQITYVCCSRFRYIQDYIHCRNNQFVCYKESRSYNDYCSNRYSSNHRYHHYTLQSRTCAQTLNCFKFWYTSKNDILFLVFTFVANFDDNTAPYFLFMWWPRKPLR